jgi:hypothetical protein
MNQKTIEGKGNGSRLLQQTGQMGSFVAARELDYDRKGLRSFYAGRYN